MKIGSRLSIAVTALLLAMSFGAARALADSSDGGSGSVTGDPAITEADGWVSFTFGGVGSSAGPFTFTGPEQINVTDGFEAGDQFAVYDGLTLLGDTSFVPAVLATVARIRRPASPMAYTALARLMSAPEATPSRSNPSPVHSARAVRGWKSFRLRRRPRNRPVCCC